MIQTPGGRLEHWKLGIPWPQPLWFWDLIASLYTSQTWHFSTKKKGDAYQPWIRVLLRSYYRNIIIVSLPRYLSSSLWAYVNWNKQLTTTAVPLDHWLVVTAQRLWNRNLNYWKGTNLTNNQEGNKTVPEQRSTSTMQGNTQAKLGVSDGVLRTTHVEIHMFAGKFQISSPWILVFESKPTRNSAFLDRYGVSFL